MVSHNIRTTCPHCGASYGGRTAHCSACHETFSSDTAFDRHLKSLIHAGCRNPATHLDKKGRPAFTWDSRYQFWRTASHDKKPNPNFTR